MRLKELVDTKQFRPGMRARRAVWQPEFSVQYGDCLPMAGDSQADDWEVLPEAPRPTYLGGFSWRMANGATYTVRRGERIVVEGAPVGDPILDAIYDGPLAAPACGIHPNPSGVAAVEAARMEAYAKAIEPYRVDVLNQSPLTAGETYPPRVAWPEPCCWQQTDSGFDLKKGPYIDCPVHGVTYANQPADQG